MDKDVANLKKWLINMGLDINDASDEMVKKLIPPQQRDMWRNIIKYVMPEEEVNLIKKSLLLQKLQKRKKPLMAKVESKEDLANAIKYEELLTKYKKIEKEIDDVKTKNNELLKYLKNIRVTKDNLTVLNEFNNINSYLAHQKTSYYFNFMHIINDLSKLCDYFTTKANDNLVKNDYEDSWEKCFATVYHAKQAGTMHDNVNLVKNISNFFYETLRDKSPSILIKTIEENLKTHINQSISALTIYSVYRDGQCNYFYSSERKALFEQYHKILLERKRNLKASLSKSEAEKNNLAKQLVENSYMFQNDIISQLNKHKHVSYTKEQLNSIAINIARAIGIVIKNCLEDSKVIGWPEKNYYDDETIKALDKSLDEKTKLEEKIVHKRLHISKRLDELNANSDDFGLDEISTEMEKMAEDFPKKIPSMDVLKKMLITMKRNARIDIENIYKPVPELTIQQEAHKFQIQKLEEIADHMESLQVFAILRKQFENFNNIICGENNNIAEITKRELNHKAQFNDSTSEIQKHLIEFIQSVKDIKLAADVVSMKTPKK